MFGMVSNQAKQLMVKVKLFFLKKQSYFVYDANTWYYWDFLRLKTTIEMKWKYQSWNFEQKDTLEQQFKVMFTRKHFN